MEQIRPKTVRLFMLQKYMQRDSNIMFCSSKQFLEFRILKKREKRKTRTGRPQNGTEIKL